MLKYISIILSDEDRTENHNMKKFLCILLTVTMLLAACATLTSCGEPKDAGAEISVYLGNSVYDFDPTDYYEDPNADQIMSLLFEPLFALDEKGNLEYAAAKSYKIDKEDNTIVIQLRQTYWSDEIRVKAEDYVYAWRNVVLEPNNPNPAAALLYDIDKALEIKSGSASIYEFGAVATDTYEITIQCREGADPMQLLKNLASVTMSPLREDVVSAAKTYWSKTLNNIVTNGPFKIASIDYATGEFTLARNLGYHQPSSVKNYTKNVIPALLINFVDADGEGVDLTYADIESKTVFYLADTSLEDRAENKSAAKSANDLSVYTYVFNTEHPLFANADVRRALSLALDREAMAQAVVFGTAANGFLPGNSTDRLSTGKNIAEAKKVLERANLSGISKSFTLTVNNDEASIAMAKLAEAAWEELGFKVSVKTVSTTKTLINDKTTASELTITDSTLQTIIKEASYGNRDFHVLGMNWQLYSSDAFVPLCSFTSHMNGNGVDYNTGRTRLNISGWWDAGYDNYLNEAYTATNDEDREAALAAAEELMLGSAPIAPVVFNTSFAFVSSDLSGITVDGFGNFVLTKASLKNYEKYLDN